MVRILTGNEFPQSGFIGRRSELAVLTDALDEALAGRGQIVLLAGEPGIGKTRTAQELALRAEQQGVQVLWGWCYENEGAPPYWPWVQLLRAYVQQADPEQLRSEMGPGAADIAEIIPEVRQKLPELEQAPALEPEQARFRLFDSVTTFLKSAAHSQPLMLVLDDLHWADKPSLLLLEFLARQMTRCSLLVVGCYRTTDLSRRHPLSETLSQLSRQPVFHRVHLQGLTEEDVGQFIQNAAGFSPMPDLVRNVHARTGGNPFFTSEVVKLLAGQGEFGDPAEIRIPEGVREAIGQRLNMLSERCNEVLTAASVIGREFDSKILKSLIGESETDDLLAELEEALGALVIEELPDAPERYWFTHDLVRETLVIEVSAARRVRLHARIAEALEDMYGGDGEAHVSELAYHFAQAEPVLGADRMVNYSMLAGEEALAAHAHEQAMGHFERALGARGVPLTGAEPASNTETAALLVGLGRAQAAALPTYRTEEAVETLGRAFEYYAMSGDIDRAVAIAEMPLLLHQATGFVSRALELVPDDSPEAGRLWSRKGPELARTGGSYTDAHESFQHALAIARRYGDTALEARALAGASNVEFMYQNHREAAELAVRGAELARKVDYWEIEALSRGIAVLSLRIIGDLPGARQQVRVMLDLADRMRNHPLVTNALMFNTTLSLLDGDWETSRALGERALAGGPLDSRQLALRILLEYQVGNSEESDVYLNRLVESIGAISIRNLSFDTFTAVALPMAARISGSNVEVQLAEECAAAAITSPFAVPLFATWARAGQALSAVSRGDSVAAQQLYSQLDPIRGTVVLVGPAGDRLLGLLSVTMGNLAQAIAHFEDALTFCRNAGYRPELAWTCCDYAEMLVERNGEGDRAKAVALLEESLAISSELGMRPLIARVAALQEQAEAQPVRAPAYPDRLTQREVDVLRLIAAGKGNREIAEQLFLSLRTIERHITNLYTKISARGKADATTYALRHDLSSFS